jgi:WhiB family redox-sensing transcriptional regulator
MTTIQRFDTLGRRIPNFWQRGRAQKPAAPPFPDEWAKKGACRNYYPDLWFPDTHSQELRATQICRTCPVIAECLNYALRWPQAGVWGGLPERDRRKLKPRKLP